MIHLLLVVIYLSFISLGLPDSLLGSAWPTVFPQFGVDVSFAGIVSMIIALGTIISSLQSDRLTRKFGAGKVTAFSVLTTCLALAGFSFCGAFWQMCLWAVPYGLGAGSVDAALNNYVALHYKSRHMSWLHCMWGIGAATGPYIMGIVISGGGSWTGGYRIISIIQLVLSALIFLSLPLWKKKQLENSGSTEKSEEKNGEVLKLSQIVSIPGAGEVMLCFFCYCALESTTGLWAASYLSIFKGVSPETAASFAAFFYIGITFGRFANGFVSMKLSDFQMIRLGQGIICAGIIILSLPFSKVLSLAGFIIIGLGCAPVYPCIIHSTPFHFGAEKSQAIIGVQMASAYVGTCLMPPFFGFLAEHTAIWILPVFLFIILVLMFIMNERLWKITGKKQTV